MDKHLKKQQKYQNLLNQIDLKIDKQQDISGIVQIEPQKNGNMIISNSAIQKNRSGFSTMDLLANVENHSNLDSTQLKQQFVELGQQKSKLVKPESSLKQEKLARKVNYDKVKQNVNKWVPLIKQNRESVQVDLTDKTPTDDKRIQSSDIKLKHNDIGFKIGKVLNTLQIANENQVRKVENANLQKLPPKQMKTIMNQIAAQRNIMFYKEVKAKRMAKIKSKLYHKIKKKKLQREQLKSLQGQMGSDMNPELLKDEIEKINLQRAQERLFLRHSTKSKYAKNLLRFGGNNTSTQKSINELNIRRKNLLQKITDTKMVDVDDISIDNQEYTDDNYREEAIKELEREFMQTDENSQLKEVEEGTKKKSGLAQLKFIEQYYKKQNEVVQDEAITLFNKLTNKEMHDSDILSDSDKHSKQDSDWEDKGKDKQQKQQKTKQTKSKSQQIQELQEKERKEFTGRMTFVKSSNADKKSIDEVERIRLENENDEILQQEKTIRNNQSVSNILDSFIADPQNQSILDQQSENQASIKMLQKQVQVQKQKQTQLQNETPVTISSIKKQEKLKQKQDQIQAKQSKNTVEHLIEEKETISLTSGLDLNKLQQKYSKQTGLSNQFKPKDIEKFIECSEMIDYDENTQLIKNAELIHTSDQNQVDFQEEKNKTLEDQVTPIKQRLLGWGSWAGHGVPVKSISEEDIIKNKQIQINKLKQSRADGKLDHLILNVQRNKNNTKYLVNKLPPNFSNKEQFNYLQSIPLGANWNSELQHKKLVQPNLITKSGQIIEPISYKKNKKE